MSLDQQLFISLEEYPGRDLSHFEDIVVSCFLGKLFFITEERNAWNWAQSSIYHGTKAFNLTLHAAKQHAEERRVQGSSWRIKEIPSCIFRGEIYELIVAETWWQEIPLKDFSETTFSSPYLLEIAELFKHRKQDPIFRFITYQGQVLPTELPFKSYYSFSVGGRHGLGWKEEKRRVSLNAISGLIRQCTQFLQDWEL